MDAIEPIWTRSIFPKRAKVVSGSALKVIACVAMLIDHVALHLLAHAFPAFKEPFAAIMGTQISAYWICRTIGRTAFPLFCFLLVEGARHTHDRLRYGLRLAVCALFSELAWDLEHTGVLFDMRSQSVMVTLLIGYGAVCALDELREKPLTLAACLAAALALACVCRADYGVRGVLLIIALRVLSQAPVARAAAGIVIESCELRCLPAYALMGLYSGERGFIATPALKAAFYAFYPAHIFLIAVLKLWLGYV